MSDLDAIGRKYKTDKSSVHHDFLRFYETIFEPMRHKEITILELGVGPSNNMGKSLLTWQEYFSNAAIIGVDIRPDAQSVSSGRISVEIGDLGSLDFLRYLATRYSPDILLDDASHLWSHQILAAEVLFPSVNPGGIYICEDLHTSFPPWTEKGYADSPIDAATWFQQLASCIVGQGQRRPGVDTHHPTPMQAAIAGQCSSIIFSKGTCALRKRGIRKP